jgi:hypothetical protein
MHGHVKKGGLNVVRTMKWLGVLPVLALALSADLTATPTDAASLRPDTLASLSATASGPAAPFNRGAQPPSGSAFIMAPDAALAAYGFPPRPNAVTSPERYATWLRVMQAARAPLDVDFVTQPQTVTRVIQPDWAGPVLFAPDAQPLKPPADRFSEIEGEWVVPFAKPTINCSNPDEQMDGSSLWIALDGWMATFEAHEKGRDGKYHTYWSTDILQAGSESDVRCYRGGPPHEYPTSAYFWIEWSGTRNIAVTKHSTDLTLKAGDTIWAKLAAETTGPHAWRRATLYLVNETTHRYLPARTFDSGCIDCGNPYQRPATLLGDTAEWMTEATFYDYADSKLPNTLDDFGKVTLTSASVTDQHGTTYEPGLPGAATPNIDWMTWQGTPLSQGGTLWACSAIVGKTTVTFSRAPYAIASPGQQGDLEPKPQNCRS